MRLRADASRFGYEVEIDNCLCQGNCAKGPTLIMDGETVSFANPVTASSELKKRIEAAKRKLITPTT